MSLQLMGLNDDLAIIKTYVFPKCCQEKEYIRKVDVVDPPIVYRNYWMSRLQRGSGGHKSRGNKSLPGCWWDVCSRRCSTSYVWFHHCLGVCRVPSNFPPRFQPEVWERNKTKLCRTSLRYLRGLGSVGASFLCLMLKIHWLPTLYFLWTSNRNPI